MKKNFEIKCKIHSDRKTKEIINSLKGFTESSEKQIDIYYKINSGRLKLRIINDSTGNLIFYNRGEETGKRISKYIISETKDFKELDNILRKLFGVLALVNKQRKIFIHKNIRVHIDKVKELGKFLEIEIIYDNLREAKNQMKELITKLELDENDFIKESYSDLLNNH